MMAAGANGGLVLSALRSVADSHDLPPACLAQLLFSIADHSAVTLEAVLPPAAPHGGAMMSP